MEYYVYGVESGKVYMRTPAYHRAHNELRAARGLSKRRRPWWSHGVDEPLDIAPTRLGRFGVARKRFLDRVCPKPVMRGHSLEWGSILEFFRVMAALAAFGFCGYLLWTMPYPWGALLGLAVGFIAGFLVADSPRR